MIFYIDESGHPNPNDPIARPVIVAVGVPIARSRELAGRMHAVKRDVLGDTDILHEEKYKAATIFNKRTFQRVPHKWQYLEQVIRLAVGFPVVTFAIVMERPDTLPASGQYLPPQWQYLIQRINVYCEKQSTHGLLVLDSCDGKTDAKLAAQIGGFLFRSAIGRMFAHVVETPLFVNSMVTPGGQLADYFASSIRQYYGLNNAEQETSDSYGAAIRASYRLIEDTILDQQDVQGGKLFGLYTMPKQKWAWTPPDTVGEDEAILP
jgi:hypothetical protein